MRLAWAILLFAFAADAATVPTNSARIGNYPTAQAKRTNYVLGVSHTGSNGIASLYAPSNIVESVVGTNVFYVLPGDNLSNKLWNLPNNSSLVLSPDVFPVPLLGSHPDATAYSLLLPNKTNVTIYGYGAILSNTTPAVAGHMLGASNFHNLKILGLEFAGGGIVDSNTGFPGLLVLDRTGTRLTVQHCTFRDSVKGIKAWTNSPTLSDLWYLNNVFTRLGDTNHPGVGGSGIDGSAIEAWGSRTYAIGNTVEYCSQGFEIYNQPNETLFSQIYIKDNHFRNNVAVNDICLLENGTMTVTDLVIENNTFTNAAGVRMGGVSDNAVIKIQGATVMASRIVGNTASGDVPDFIYVSPGSISGSIISNNKRKGGSFSCIRFDSLEGCNFNIIAGNNFENVPWRPFWIEGSGNTISGNLVRNANTAGVLLSACFVGPDGGGTASTNNNIFGNSFIDDQGSATTRSGIEFAASANANYVGHNFYSRVQTNVHDLGANNRISPRPVLEGTTTLSSGLATVSTVWVHANSRILLTPRATANAVSGLCVTNVSNGASFQIRSESSTDANRVDWIMSEPQ